MTPLGGRETFIGWSGVSCSKETSIPLPSPPSLSSLPCSQYQSQKKSTVEEEEKSLDGAIKSDSQLLTLAENGLKSLQGKLELVLLAKKENDAVFYWEFPLWLSQSRLGGRKKESDECTLISMSIAEAFYSDENLSNILRLDQKREGFTDEQQLAMSWHKVCPPELIRLLKESIVKGNAIYDEEKKRGVFSVFYDGIMMPLKEILCIPDAVRAWNRQGQKKKKSVWARLFCGFMGGGSGAVGEIKDHSEMMEVDYVAVKGSIGANLPKCTEYAIHQRDTDLICVIDSHDHDRRTKGSIISVSNRQNFPEMAKWMQERLFRSHFTEQQKFEFSLVQLANGEAIALFQCFAKFSTNEST